MITLALLALLLLPFLAVGALLSFFSRASRRAIIRWCAVIYVALAAFVILGIGPYLAAWTIAHSGTRPPDRNLKDTPGQYGVAFEDIAFDARDGLKLSGWFIPPSGRNAVLVSTHGLFRNRVEVLERSIPLAKAGYGVLLYDTRSHGSSSLGLVSLGYHERNDVLGAIDYIRRRYQDSPDRPEIMLMGVSMGAAATIEAAAESKDYAALILDSPFSSIPETVTHHSWLLLKLPKYPFTPLFLFWFERLAQFDPGRVDSRRALAKCRPVPLLLIASEGDVRMGAAIARELLGEAKSPVKQLQVFGKEVGHGSAARVHPEAYATLLLQFAEKSLKAPAWQLDGEGTLTGSSAEAGSPK